MYKLQVSTKSGYRVATFEAGTTLREANEFYYAFRRSGLYSGYQIAIKEVKL